MTRRIMGSNHHQWSEVFESSVMKKLLSYVDRAAKSDVPILLLGPSGCGKEVLATRVHRNSNRANAPFVAVNCGALHEELLLSELFGHVEGAFTGAMFSKRGLVEEADGGTLFLDEIGELPLSVQARVLRFLQSGEYFRVGSSEVHHVNVRIIAATNRNIDRAVESGLFREDLFYRLSTVTFQVPALFERPEDCHELILRFLNDKSIGGKSMSSIEPNALQALQDYHWPGNIRQLKNVMERSKILSQDSTTLRFSDLPSELTEGEGQRDHVPMPPPQMSMEEVERRHLFRALGHFHGNKTRAARSLGLTIKTLYNKLARYEAEGLLDSKESVHVDHPDSSLRN